MIVVEEYQSAGGGDPRAGLGGPADNRRHVPGATTTSHPGHSLREKIILRRFAFVIIEAAVH